MAGKARVSPFEQIRHMSDDGDEFWSARELAKVLGYRRWETFPNVVAKAKIVCENSGHAVMDHFVSESKMIVAGKGAEREIIEYQMSRYAAYLTVLCADFQKPEVVYFLAHITEHLTGTRISNLAATTYLNIPDPLNIAVTKEQITIGQIVRAFKHLRSIRHYRVAPYYVGLYFPDCRIAVECDENGHSDKRNYVPQVENERQIFIERALECQFVRYNPDDPDFNVGDVINRIMLLVSQGEERQDESEVS